MTQSAVSIRALRKSYGAFEALKGIDLDIRPGEVFSILGPNGAGKTTLVEILEGYRSRSAGDATVLGSDPGHPTAAWRARIGIVLQSTVVFDELTVQEVIEEFSRFYPQPLDTGRVIGLVGLDEKRRARCGNLSGGQKRRVDLALGLIGNPELIFLDEPTTGLDPEGRRQLWDVVRQFAALGKTVVLTTHYLEEAEALADRVAVIIGGELAAIGAPRKIGGRQHRFTQVAFEAIGVLATTPLPAGLTATLAPPLVTIATATPTAAVVVLSSWAKNLGFDELPGLVVTRPSLEDIYLQRLWRRFH
ncbi:MAG: ABC transporter ATP-binding protein [Anaerolineaceae bacterium]